MSIVQQPAIGDCSLCLRPYRECTCIDESWEPEFPSDESEANMRVDASDTEIAMMAERLKIEIEFALIIDTLKQPIRNR